jgi:hypothetical protein
MPMMLNCSAKGCHSYDEHVLDLTTNTVKCIKCNATIPNVSHFTIQQLKSLKQTKKAVKSAYAIRCGKCKIETLPKLDINNNLVCGACSDPSINVSKPFELLIREAIKTGNKDIV